MNIKRQLLFCPGPVNIASNVKEATHHEIGHREPEFSSLMKSLNSNILNIYEIRSKRSFHPVFITGSGTATNEAVLSSVIHDKNILILSNGEFGERLFEISSIHNKNTFILRFGWAKEFDPIQIEKFIKDHDIQAVAMVHHETSVGLINHVEKVGRLAKKYNLIFILDTISSVGAEKIDIEKNHITFTTGTSGKALGALPGVGIVIARRKDYELLKDLPAKTAYLNLYKFYHYSTTLHQTPNTPAVQLFHALDQASKNIIEEGVLKTRRNLKAKAEILRIGMKKLGLGFYLNEENMSSVLTTVTIPKYLDFPTLKAELRKRNIVIYNGKGPLTDKVFQVGNIGQFEQEDILYFLNSLKDILLTYKEGFKTKNNDLSMNLNPESQHMGRPMYASKKVTSINK